MSLIRYIAAAALRKLAGPEQSAPPRLALPSPSAGLLRQPQQRLESPMLRGTPVWPEPSHAMPPIVAPPAYPAPAPARPRRRKVTITEEIFTRRRG